MYDIIKFFVSDDNVWANTNMSQKRYGFHNNRVIITLSKITKLHGIYFWFAVNGD
jgi:hypothetical protein